jgi:hypothetical protein
VGAHILDPIYFPEGTEVPDATQMIYDALNQVHMRVGQYGDEAAHPDWQPPGDVDEATAASAVTS